MATNRFTIQSTPDGRRVYLAPGYGTSKVLCETFENFFKEKSFGVAFLANYVNTNTTTTGLSCNTFTWPKLGGGYRSAISIYTRSTEPVQLVLHVECCAASKQEVEDKVCKLFASCFKYYIQMDSGNEVVEDKQLDESSENVKFEGISEEVKQDEANVVIEQLRDKSCTEKYYDFNSGPGSILNRWFPLDTVKFSSQPFEDPIKYWFLPQHLIEFNKLAVNLVPLKVFAYGTDIKLTFKIIMQAHPFEAGLVMLSYMPAAYGLTNPYHHMSIVALSDNDKAQQPYTGRSTSYSSIWSYYAAVQRPHCIMDVNKGGEAELTIPQKYCRTLVSLYDYETMDVVPAGIRGSYFGAICLHSLSTLNVGPNSLKTCDIKVFYKFDSMQVTGMLPIAMERAGKAGNVMFEKVYRHNIKSGHIRPSDIYSSTKAFSPGDEYITQGPVLSIVSRARDVTDTAGGILKAIETPLRRGLTPRNRDKPIVNDCQIVVVPRPRLNFGNAVAYSDAIPLTLHWKELPLFFESFTDEPSNVDEFIQKPGLFYKFNWAAHHDVDTILMSWCLDPTILPFDPTHTGNKPLTCNVLTAPLSIMASMYTNRSGPMELYFQFVKTPFHRGSLEISISYGRRVKTIGQQSSYLTVLSIQEGTGFSVVIPYIFDTPVVPNAGTAIPYGIPDVFYSTGKRFENFASLNVRVLNELVHPDTVSNSIEVLVWLKALPTFKLSFLRPMNTNTLLVYPYGKLHYDDDNLPDIYNTTNSEYQQYEITDGSAELIPYKNNVNGFSVFFTQMNEQSTQDHGDFKNILKTPVRIIKSWKLRAQTKQRGREQTQEYGEQIVPAFNVIPCAPLSTSLVQYLNDNFYPNVFEHKYEDMFSIFKGPMHLFKTPQFQVNSMFGLFRGTLNFTIVVTHGVSPVYITYLPHDNKLRRPLTTLPMVHFKYQTIKDVFLPNVPEGLGYSSELSVPNLGLPMTVIIPKINSTETISIPFSNTVNWLNMNRTLISTNNRSRQTLIKSYTDTMRDNSSWFNGYICISVNDDVTVDVLMNNGDEFELGGFIGHAPMSNMYSAFTLPDAFRYGTQNHWNGYVTQMGIVDKFKSVQSKVYGATESYLKNMGITAACVVTTPALPNGLALITGAVGVCASIEAYKSARKIGFMLEEAKETTVQIYDQIQVEDAAYQAYKILRELFPYLPDNTTLANKIWIVLNNIVHAVIGGNWLNTAFGVFSIMVSFQLMTYEMWDKVKTKFTEFFVSFENRGFVTQAFENSEPKWVAMIEAIIAAVAMKVNIAISGGFMQYLRSLFYFTKVENSLGLVNSMINVIRIIMRGVTKVIYAIWEYKDPKIQMLRRLQNCGGEFAEFCDEAEEFLNHFNDKDIRKKENRVKYLHCIMRAYKLKSVLLQFNDIKLTSQLLGYCNEVIKKSVRLRYLFQCDVIKTEPYVLCISGQSEIGKSFSVYDLAVTMLESIGYKTNTPNVIYTVPAGVQYWNGYNDEPVIWYDDWCNLMDETTLVSHLSQLYALKTSAPYNVPRAELDNKEQIAAPLIVIMTTNNPFPKHPIIIEESAVFRRRDSLVKFSLKNGRTLSSFTRHELEKYEHIVVQKYGTPREASSLSEEIIGYKEFKTQLCSHFQAFHKKEMLNKELKYRTILKVVSTSSIDNINLQNPFDVLDKATEIVVESKQSTFNILDTEVQRLVFEIKKHLQLQDLPDDASFVVQSGFGDLVNRMYHLTSDLAFKISTKASKGYICIKDELKKKLVSSHHVLMDSIKYLKDGFAKCDWCSSRTHHHGINLWCSSCEVSYCVGCASMAGLKKDAQDNAAYWVNVIKNAEEREELNKMEGRYYVKEDLFFETEKMACPHCNKNIQIRIVRDAKHYIFVLLASFMVVPLSIMETLNSIFIALRMGSWQQLQLILGLKAVMRFLKIMLGYEPDFQNLNAPYTYVANSYVKNITHKAKWDGFKIQNDGLEPIVEENEDDDTKIGTMIFTNSNLKPNESLQPDAIPSDVGIKNLQRDVQIDEMDRLAAIDPAFAQHSYPIETLKDMYIEVMVNPASKFETFKAWRERMDYLPDLTDGVLEALFEESRCDTFDYQMYYADMDIKNLYNKADAVKDVIVKGDKERISRLFKDHQGSAYKFKYICPHSLLAFTHIYNNNYQVTIADETYEIMDVPCMNHDCVLYNRRFLEIIKVRTEIASLYIKHLKNGDLDYVKVSIPRFMRFESEATKRKFKLRNLLRKDWWEFYVFSGDGWQTFTQWVKTLAPVLVATTAIWYVSRHFSKFWKWFKVFGGFNCESPGPRTKQKRRLKSRNMVKPMKNFVTQDITQCFEGKLNKMSANYVLLTIDNGEGFAYGWGVFRNTLVTPIHVVDKMRKVKKFTMEFVYKQNEKLVILVENCTFESIKGKDLCMIHIAKNKVLFQDCRKFLRSKKNMFASASEYILMEADYHSQTVHDVIVNIDGLRSDFTAKSLTRKEQYSTDTVIMYDYQKDGLCGCLLVADTHQPIISMHVAGNPSTQRGIGALIFLEDFEHLTQASLEIDIDYGEVDEFIEDQEEEANFYAGDDCVISYVSVVSKERASYVPDKTKYEKSPIYDLLPQPEISVPAILSAKDPRYKFDKPPLWYGVRKNGIVTLDFNADIVRMASNALIPFLLRGKLIRRPTVLDPHTAVAGFPGIDVQDPFLWNSEDEPYYAHLPFDTSAGYPYSNANFRNRYGIVGTNKAAWLEQERQDNGELISVKVHDVILRHHEHNMQLRRKGVAALNIFQDCLKDEKKRAIKAYKEGGTRLFSMSNLEGSIALRRYTLDLVNFLRYNRIKNGIAIGINPESIEWTELANTLLNVNTKLFSTDFTNFGPGLNYYCGMEFANLIVAFYKKYGALTPDEMAELRIVATTLVEELMGSYHIVGNTVYKTYAGSPSGACVTAEINSFVHLLYLIIAWKIIGICLAQIAFGDGCFESKYLSINYWEFKEYILKKDLFTTNQFRDLARSMTMEGFFDNVIPVVYGDDGIFSVSDEFCEIFNCTTVNLILMRHGIGITDATKSEQLMTYGSIWDVSFLKRKFIMNELMPHTLFQSQMDKDTMYGMMYYIKKSKHCTKQETMYYVCYASLLFAFGYGREFYDTHRDYCNYMLEKVKIKPLLLSYDDIVTMFYADVANTNLFKSEVKGFKQILSGEIDS